MSIKQLEIEINANNKRDIIDIYSKKLNFPAYYDNNWDSFEECLIDFIEESDTKIIINNHFNKDQSGELGKYIMIICDIQKAYPDGIEINYK